MNKFQIGVPALVRASDTPLAGTGVSWRAGMPASVVVRGIDSPIATRLRTVPPHVLDTSVPEPRV